MTDEAVAVVRNDDIDEKIWTARLHGVSVRRIVREFGVSAKEVHAVCDQRVLTVDEKLRRRTLALELGRLDQLQQAWFNKAINGDLGAALLVLKIAERRSAYLNLDHQAMRRDQPTIVIPPPPRESSTDRIRAVLDQLIKQRPRPVVTELTQSLPPPDTGVVPESAADRDPEVY